MEVSCISLEPRFSRSATLPQALPLAMAVRRTVPTLYLDSDPYVPPADAPADFVIAAQKGQCTTTGRTANGYQLIGTGPLQTHITNGLADAMQFLSSTPAGHGNGQTMSFNDFQLHSIRYDQLAFPTLDVPADLPNDVSVFSLRTVCTPDPSGRFKNGVTTHFVWSPLLEEWLVQVWGSNFTCTYGSLVMRNLSTPVPRFCLLKVAGNDTSPPA
mmetsp:Transcript_5499/g.17315  ORF Transcript_5499/g.17315 Transcript_5499/m.17315 type:complete len:214 (+) Transcript_5499:338-979(+)